MNYDLITKAGLTRQEFADLIGVSHVMVWKWEKQGVVPRETWNGAPLRKRVEVALTILDKLIEKGQLPKKDLAFVKRMHPEVRERRAQVNKKIRQLLDDRVALTPAN